MAKIGESMKGVAFQRSVSAYVPFVLVFLVAVSVSALLLSLPGYEGDIDIYRGWTRLITLHGISIAYSGTYPETAANYPPVLLYIYLAVGHAYQAWLDPTFSEAGLQTQRMLAIGIKSVAAVSHLALGALLFGLLRRSSGVRPATAVAAVYLLNPAALLDSAYWGQPDGVHTFALVIALWLLETGYVSWSWVAAAIAALTKPQAWILMPLFLTRSWARQGSIRTLRSVFLLVISSIVVLLPFELSGRLGDFLRVTSQIVIPTDSGIGSGIPHTAPVATAFAHNLWWLITGGEATTTTSLVPDQAPLFAGASYRAVGQLLVLIATGFVLLQALRMPAQSLFILAALQAFAWFCLSTGAHENHAFMVIPLLSMALATTRWIWPMWAILSLTLLLNILLQDFGFLTLLGRLMFAPQIPETFHFLADSRFLQAARLGNAAANLLVLFVWFAWTRNDLFNPRSASTAVYQPAS